MIRDEVNRTKKNEIQDFSALRKNPKRSKPERKNPESGLA
jgi:hypothetical protein